MRIINTFITFLVLIMLSCIMFNIEVNSNKEDLICGELTIKLPIQDIRYYTNKTFGDKND